MANKMISLEMPEELKEKLRIKAFEMNISISKLIRILLEDGLKEEEKTNQTESC